MSIFTKKTLGILCKTEKQYTALKYLHLMLDFLIFHKIYKMIDSIFTMCYSYSVAEGGEVFFFDLIDMTEQC